MTTFSPDDKSIWHDYRQSGEELPVELVAARREWLRRNNRARNAVRDTDVTSVNQPPVPSLNEVVQHWHTISENQSPVEHYRDDYRRYLHTRHDWDRARFHPMWSSRGSPTCASVFSRVWAASEQIARRVAEERDRIVNRLIEAVDHDQGMEAAASLCRTGPGQDQ